MSRKKTSVEELNNEQYMISLAIKQAEQQLRDGTAPPSIVVHYLRLAGENGRLERERIEVANELNRKKADAIEADVESKNAVDGALEAMRKYYR